MAFLPTQQADAVGNLAGGLRVPGGATRRTAAALRSLAAWTAVAAVVLATGLVLALSIGPRFLPYDAYTIVSGSMRPGIPVGSVAVVRPVSSFSLKPGDVISFHRPDVPKEIVTHRILRIETSGNGRFFVTKGDANSLPDPWRVPANGVGRRYAFDIPYLGYGVTALQVPIGRLALGALLVVVTAVLALRRIWRPQANGAQTS